MAKRKKEIKVKEPVRIREKVLGDESGSASLLHNVAGQACCLIFPSIDRNFVFCQKFTIFDT